MRDDGLPAGLEIECVDTGEDTPTGGRVAGFASACEGRASATYADGVADVDLRAELAFHAAHGRHATMTVVQPRLQFGVARIDGADVEGRGEAALRRLVNGGFFVFEEQVLDRLADDSVLEHEPLERLAGEGELRAFRHTGFWDCMDTYKTPCS